MPTTSSETWTDALIQPFVLEHVARRVNRVSPAPPDLVALTVQVLPEEILTLVKELMLAVRMSEYPTHLGGVNSSLGTSVKELFC